MGWRRRVLAAVRGSPRSSSASTDRRRMDSSTTESVTGMQIRTVGVLGCGLMGSGIAQVCAGAGYTTIVGDTNKKMLERGQARIKKFLEDGIAKGKVTQDQSDTTLANLTGTTEFAAMRDCDLIIEA